MRVTSSGNSFRNFLAVCDPKIQQKIHGVFVQHHDHPIPSMGLPSLKLTWHLKMDGWNTTFFLGWPIFRGELLVLGSVARKYLPIHVHGWFLGWISRVNIRTIHINMDATTSCELICCFFYQREDLEICLWKCLQWRHFGDIGRPNRSPCGVQREDLQWKDTSTL